MSLFTKRILYKKTQLAYYKLGDGPFYVFYTPFHLPHIQLPSTIARAVIHADPTVAPISGPSCEVVTVAKQDLKAGDAPRRSRWFLRIWIDRQSRKRARRQRAADRAVRRLCAVRDIRKDASIGFDDVKLPATRLSDELWLRATTALADGHACRRTNANCGASRVWNDRLLCDAGVGDLRATGLSSTEIARGEFKLAEIAILGSGMAGFGAASRLDAETGLRPVVYEQSAYFGGHTASFRDENGFLFDLGPHISFTKDPRIQDLFAKNVDQKYESLQINLNNYWRGHWVTHPVQLHLNALPRRSHRRDHQRLRRRAERDPSDRSRTTRIG